MYRRAAVHDEGLAGHEIAVVAGEEDEGAGSDELSACSDVHDGRERNGRRLSLSTVPVLTVVASDTTIGPCPVEGPARQVSRFPSGRRRLPHILV